MTNVLRVPTHVMQIQTARIVMVHLNAFVKMVFLEMGKHAKVSEKKMMYIYFVALFKGRF